MHGWYGLLCGFQVSIFTNETQRYPPLPSNRSASILLYRSLPTIRIFGVTADGVVVVEHALRSVVIVMTVGVVLMLEPVLLSGAEKNATCELVLAADEVLVVEPAALLELLLALSGPSTPPTTLATSPALATPAAAER